MAQTNYKDWIGLFGHTAEEPAVKALLRSAGVTKRLVMPRDELDLLIDIPGMTVNFQDAELFEDLPPVGSGNCVLTGVVLRLEKDTTAYEGPLPYDVKRDSSQADLRARFGKPSESESDIGWDRWIVADKLTLTAQYTGDRASIEALMLSLPEPD
ncbi:hypothetical protein B5V01_33710 [Mesorhizobium erdmanii]|uniref:Uncharacterized protein n=2 Tax=Mesorhizobium TaxID=68287 RepID=A0A3M9XGA9_9HYPH|nr:MULTISPECIES: hypothetical protein [Mesorhizobium]RNJ46984.1 hypothetical protein DNR46_03725 [Mesorhizobium japonicum]RXT34011.1 hypothetical protein B5V01_33710 [Mesorhizobium erdmanii]